MTTINYFNIYSLNYSRINDFKNAMSSFTDDLQPKFQAAFRTDDIKDNIKGEKRCRELLKTSLSNTKEENPGTRMFAESVIDLSKSIENAEALLAKYKGVNPYQIQTLINYVFGIEDLQLPISNEIKKNYFLAMKSSGFLSTPYSPLEQPLVYQPGLLAAEFLSQHPEIKTITLGCGEAGNIKIGACHIRRKLDHATPSLTIDLSASMGPNVVVNMHDPHFWESIPSDRFENVFDHSYGYFLFDDPRAANTLQHIYRVLQSGGYLKMDHYFREEHVQMLTKAGFHIESREEQDQRIAKKQ